MKIADSYAEEFIAKFNRINKMIKHGPSIGNYHENVVRSFLTDFLVSRYSVKTGFIYDNEKDEVTKQIDILIIDESYPAAYYFKEHDFAIVDKNAVVCAIEIKSHMNKNNFIDIANKAYDFRKICSSGFYLAFIFESSTKDQLRELKKYYESIKNIPDDLINYTNSIFILNKGIVRLVGPNSASRWGNYLIINSNKNNSIESLVVSNFLATIIQLCEMKQKITGNPFIKYANYEYLSYNNCLRYGKIYDDEKFGSVLK